MGGAFAFSSNVLAPGDAFEQMFDCPGVFFFKCSDNPEMKVGGQIIIIIIVIIIINIEKAHAEISKPLSTYHNIHTVQSRSVGETRDGFKSAGEDQGKLKEHMVASSCLCILHLI